MGWQVLKSRPHCFPSVNVALAFYSGSIPWSHCGPPVKIERSGDHWTSVTTKEHLRFHLLLLLTKLSGHLRFLLLLLMR